MNKRLFRTQFNQMENIEKQVLMESLATRYNKQQYRRSWWKTESWNKFYPEPDETD